MKTDLLSYHILAPACLRQQADGFFPDPRSVYQALGALDKQWSITRV